jgi:hypothetical protein
MALGEDQKAMLRLLAQREQGYDDIAALMGLSVDEVRAKVKDALAQLEDEGVAPPPLPPEPPLATTAEESGPEPTTVDPEPLEPAAPEPPITAEPEPAAPEPSAAPGPEPPAKPAEAEKSAPKSPKRPSSGPPKLSLPAGKGPRAAIAAGIAVVILVVVVLIVSGGGGGDSSTTSASTQGTTEAGGAAQNASTASNGKVTEAVLGPVGGGSGSGVATFGRVKKSLALQVVAKGLAPTTTGNSYTVWLAQSPQRMLPLASTPAKKGVIGAQFEVPVEVLAYLANETFKQLVVTDTNDKELEAALSKATKEERAPAYTGTAVLEGTVTGPIVGAATRKEEEEKEEKSE